MLFSAYTRAHSAPAFVGFAVVCYLRVVGLFFHFAGKPFSVRVKDQSGGLSPVQYSAYVLFLE